MNSIHPAPKPEDASTAWRGDTEMLKPFPTPPQDVRAAIERLHLAATSPLTDEDELRKLAALPRPWDPATCHGGLRTHLCTWLDEVADWINTQHLWALRDPGLPACWPAHPHLVHDLAVVATTRYLASYAITPAALEDWHRYALPAFLSRLSERLGDGCLAGHPELGPRHSRDLEFAQVRAIRRSEQAGVDQFATTSGRRTTPSFPSLRVEPGDRVGSP